MLEEKIKIVDEIVKRHPSIGVDRGWSCYTGGMADTGYWYFRKMLDETLPVLQTFLINLVAEENQPRKESTKSQKELHEEFHNETERRLLWGK